MNLHLGQGNLPKAFLPLKTNSEKRFMQTLPLKHTKANYFLQLVMLLLEPTKLDLAHFESHYGRNEISGRKQLSFILSYYDSNSDWAHTCLVCGEREKELSSMFDSIQKLLCIQILHLRRTVPWHHPFCHHPFPSCAWRAMSLKRETLQYSWGLLTCV